MILKQSFSAARLLSRVAMQVCGTWRPVAGSTLLAPTHISARAVAQHYTPRAAAWSCGACQHRVPQVQHWFAAPSRQLSKHARIRAPRLAPVAAAHAAFFAQEQDSFADINLDEEVVEALAAAGFTKPARIQADTAEVLMAGSSAVIASETGSGKTLSYVAPVASLLLRQKRRQATMEKPLQFHALVLCPNLTLCQQVMAVVHSLKGPDGQPLLNAAMVNSSNPPPFKAPDFIVATPAGLINFLQEANGAYGGLWTEEGMQARVVHVVLDEADLLLTPAFAKPVNHLLQLLRSGDRRRVEAKLFEEMGFTEQQFDKLPVSLKKAAWRGGAQGLLDAGYKPRKPIAEDAQFGPYWKRQYVFAAATMPAITQADVGSQIERYYPDAVWISSAALHTSKAAVTHVWKQVDDSTWLSELTHAILDDPDRQAGCAKVLVFAQDTKAADQLSEHLNDKGIQHVVYHKNRPMEESKQALRTMQESAAGVMVCTDAAARGLDIQDVTHVIQSDFAPNAIDFIHRTGRTGRATRSGKVTSFYRDHNVALVEVLRAYIAEGRPLEAAFSRARSFSKKMERRQGNFVPRGMTGTDYKKAMQDKQQPVPTTSN